MKYLIPLLILLSSCMTVKKIERHCDLFAKICVTEVEKEFITKTIDTTIYRYRDTSFYHPVEPEIKYIEKPVSVEQGIINSKQLRLETDLCLSYSQVINSQLKAKLEQKDTMILVRLNNAILEIDHWKSKYTQEKIREKIIVKKDTGFGKFAKKWFIGSLAVILLIVAGLIVRFKSKFFG